MNIGKAHLSVLATTIGKPRTFDGKPIHGKGGISAVCLRRGGRLVTVSVDEMVNASRRAQLDALPRPATSMLAAAKLTKKKPKRKGAKR